MLGTILLSVLTVLVLCAVVFVMVPSIDPYWMLTEAERRQLWIGQRLERVWPTLTEQEQRTLEDYLDREPD